MALPEGLIQAMSDRSLAILCGAGVSMLPPSYLPGWWEFNVLLFDEIKRSACRILPEGMAPLFQRMHLSDNSVLSFSERVETLFAGEGYFPVLDVLDGKEPNENHRAMAELAGRGVLKIILSTNFDTLIEQAFDDAGVPLEVAVGETGLAGLSGSACVLMKLHGSVGAHSTLIDTVRQKLRGLPGDLRSKIATVAATHHILALGISGADLRFRHDYLPLAAGQRPGVGPHVARENACRDGR